ncbi:MAG: TrmH family RNA methyltransferase, partial [Terriglobales bacterium]
LLTEFRRAFKNGPEGGGMLALEGPRLVGEAIRSGARIEKALFSRTGLEHHGAKLLPQFSKHTSAGVAGDAAFAAAMEVEHPQGVAVLLRFAPPELAQVFGAAPALVIAAAGVQDPGNLGTLIRAADAFGATGVAVLADTVSPYNPKAVRASAGSLFHLPVAAKVAAADLIAMCRQRGVRLLAAAARAQTSLETAGLAGPVCLVIGQEAEGVPRALLRAADATLAIPMAREVDSLNAGVAGAILLYEAARQRRA